MQGKPAAAATGTRPVVLAVVAHPDDVEFSSSGTLMLLAGAGAEIHVWNLADGSLGSMRDDARTTAGIRTAEARAAGESIGAAVHAPIFKDLAIFYDSPSLARVAAGLREIQPDVVLTHPLSDYMEDHQNTARLAVTALFSRSMANFVSEPPRPPWSRNAALYHSLPHGLREPSGEPAKASHFVNIAPLLERKRRMLSHHRSQGDWLKASQGMDAYLDAMERFGRETGGLSGVFEVAEGFTQHNPLGFGPKDWDPLSELLGVSLHRRLAPSSFATN